MPDLPRASEAELGSGVARSAAAPNLLAIGGGSGLPVLLSGLKRALPPLSKEQLTAIVTVADDGGSSGRLRRELGVLPPGDIRNCLVALADDEDLLARLFQYRFRDGNGLSGHSFGNLFLSALSEVAGDFYQAILTAESVLSVRGRILPATLADLRLRAQGSSGRLYLGESAIGSSGERLRSLSLDPAEVAAFAPAVEAIAAADLIVLGPGSLFTSLLPNLLIPGISEALRAASCPVVLVLNLMTQPGETDGLDARGHLEALNKHAGAGLVDCVLVNREPPPSHLLRHYEATGAQPIVPDRAALQQLDVEVCEADLLLSEDGLIRHDSDKLARAVLALAADWPAIPPCRAVAS